MWSKAINQSELFSLNDQKVVSNVNSLSFGFRHSLDFSRSVFRHSLYTPQWGFNFLLVLKKKQILHFLETRKELSNFHIFKFSIFRVLKFSLLSKLK